MQPWQINILELEQSVLKHLGEFIAQHMLAVSICIIYSVIALGVWLMFHLRRRQGKRRSRPVIFIETQAPPPQPGDTFSPFSQHSGDCDCDDED